MCISAHHRPWLPLVKVVATGGTIANPPQLKKIARLEVEQVIHQILSLTVKTDKPIVLSAAQRQ